MTCKAYGELRCGAQEPQCKTEPIGVYGQQNLMIWEMPPELPPAYGDVVHQSRTTAWRTVCIRTLYLVVTTSVRQGIFDSL